MAEAAGSSAGSAGENIKADKEHFVDKHQFELIKRVSKVAPILDELLRENVIQQESYDKIRTLPTSQVKMRELLTGPLRSSGVQGKDIFYKILNRNEPDLIEDLKRMEVQVETMVSVIELLLETLKHLSDEELEKFKEVLRQITILTYYSDITLMLLNSTDVQDVVFSVVQTFGQQSVEKTKEVLKRMKRTDLVQRLSDSSSGPKRKPFMEEDLSAVFYRVATLAVVKEQLLETFKHLSDKERKSFKWFLQFLFFQRSLPDITDGELQGTNSADELVDMMASMCGQQSLELTREVFKDMNRTDLVQKLSISGPKAAGSPAEAFGVNTTEGEKQSVDEQWPALIQKVETMASVVQLLLETLKDLSDTELERFKKVIIQIHPRYYSYMPSMLHNSTDMQDTVFSMAQSFGQQSVEKAKEAVKMMKRTDLVQRLSDSSSEPKKKHSADELHSALIQRVATIAAVKQLLLETLNNLSNEELGKFRRFLQLIIRQMGLPDITEMWRIRAERAEIADQMLQNFGQQSVELTREVFMNMNRTDLIQRLSKPSSGLKGKHTAPIERDMTMTSIQENLLETLEGLSYEELEKFKHVLQYTKMKEGLPRILRHRMETADRVEIVKLMVENYSPRSVEVTKEGLKDINWRDLMTSLGFKEVYRRLEPALFDRDVVMAILQEYLLDTLKDLGDGELEKFKHVLQYTKMKDDLPRIPRHLMETADRFETVKLMVEYYGQQFVEVTSEVLKEMNWSDLKSRPGFKEVTRKLGSALSERDVTMTSLQEEPSESLQEDLLEALKDLSYGELEKFKHVLQYTKMKGFPGIPRHLMETADIVQTVELMVENYGQQSVEVTREVLKKMNRRDLVQRLSDISSGSKGPSRSLKLEACGSMMQDSNDWTKLEPEVSHTDADEAPTYSLQSEEGNFECSVSGLRWICKEKVSFKYRFRSGEEPVERIESMKYMPAGPLMDIKIIAGKFDEMYLPHWICIDDNPAIKDKFAVLHIEECGDFVEKVSEVTSSHVKLSEPHFSLKMVLVKADVPVKTKCMVLIYKTNTAFLTLHVYLVPHDPGLQQAMDMRQLSYGYKVIRKPYPEKSLKMRDRFVLTADLDSAKICPENLKLRYDNRDPNFFEVYIENPDRNFMLNLAQTNETQPEWTREIRKDEYQSTAHTQGQHFVDKHQRDLIKRVSNIGPILDHLLTKRVIQQEGYAIIRAIPTPQEQMRAILSGPLNAGGDAAKDIFYQILEEEEPYLVDDLQEDGVVNTDIVKSIDSSGKNKETTPNFS